MNTQYEELPDWCAKALENMEKRNWQPGPGCDHLREECHKAFENADRIRKSREKASSGIVDLVMSVSGKLLETTASLFQVPQSEFAFAARSATARGVKGRKVIWANRKKSKGGTEICSALIMENGTPKVEINLVKDTDLSDVRPFTIEVTDEEGALTTEPILVQEHGLPPLFPAPSRGWFRFVLRWDDFEDEMVISVK